MPTAGEYEIEFFWLDGNTPDGDHQESVWWEKGAVCKVGLGDFEVTIYVEGDDLFTHKVVDERYTTAVELNALGIETDKMLHEALDDDGYLIQQNNSWFDIYTPDGEHLDMVNHEADEAFDQACFYLIGQFSNFCQIENNQLPEINGRRVFVSE